jgi:hypothetical protein
MVAAMRRWGPGLGLAIGVCFVTLFLRAEPPQKSPVAKTTSPKAHTGNLMRLVRDAHDEPVALCTPVIHMRSVDPAHAGLVVDLIGAVHIGEKSYYAELNKRFDKYDAVLYELVSQKDLRPTPGARSGSPISAVQVGMKDILNLEFQLDAIDYHKKNFVHADMSPEQFAKTMSDRGESIWTMLAQMWGAGIATQAGRSADESDLLFALFDKNRAIQLKRYMAEQMEDMEGAMRALDGPQGSAIITERNKAAIKVLGEEIAAGKKKLAIFYGAGHLADMEKRIHEEFGLQRTSIEWLEAWNLRLPDAK